jgi:hypothetical protein
MFSHCMMIAALTLDVTACASGGAGQQSGAQPAAYPPDSFSHQVATSDLVLYWNCSRAQSGVLRVDGVAQNPWAAQPIRFLEFDLVGADGQGRTVSQAKAAARDIQIFTSQASPFQLELQLAGSETRFDLYYEYQFHIEENEAMLAGPPVHVPRLFAQANRFLARDVCSETQHRVR